MKNQKGFTVMELLIVIAILGILAAVFVPIVLKISADYSEGERVGTLIKFSKKGLYCKTWEGSLNLGQIDSNGQAQTFDFSLDPKNGHMENEKELSEIGKVLVGKRVSVKYIERIYINLCRGDATHKAVEIKEAK